MGAAASDTGAAGSAALDRPCTAHPLCTQHTVMLVIAIKERFARLRLAAVRGLMHLRLIVFTCHSSLVYVPAVRSSHTIHWHIR